MSLKILQINKFHYLKGGSERYVFSLTELLESKGHTVIPFSMKSKVNVSSEYSDYFAEFVDLYKLSPKNIVKFFYNYDAVRKLKKLIEKERPDIAHLHNFAHQLTPGIILLLKKHNIPVVMTLHAYKHICPNSNLYNRDGNCQKCLGGKYYNCLLNNCMHESRAKSFLGMLEAYLNNRFLKAYDKVDVFIAPSRYMKEVSLKFGIAPQKIELVYNFLSNEYLKDAGAGINLRVDRNNEYLLYFGRLSREKGVATLIEATTLIKDKNLKLKIAGSGPDEVSLKKLIEKLDLADRVELVGYQQAESLEKLIKDAKAVIMPSLWPENMPYALLESLAMGKIVIVSKVGGMPELIENNENGFLFTAGDSIDLANKIDDIQGKTEVYLKQIGTEAQAKALTLNPESHYEAISNIYKSLMKS